MAQMSSERPGFMLYFDLRPALAFLNDEDRGRLLMAAFDYAEFAAVPEFDGVLGMCWAMMQPKLDHDERSYLKKCRDKRYATYCRECKKNDIDPLPLELWAAEIDEKHQPISVDINRYPTTTPTTAPTPTTTPTATANTTATGGGGDFNPNPFNDPDINFERKRQERLAQAKQLFDSKGY